MSDSPNAIPIPAATILIVREGATGLEVFMVKRHHQVDFVAGALVFPGGKVAKGDSDAALADFIDCGDDLPVEMRSFAAAAIREAFEESGILFAREAGQERLVSPERLARLAPYRSGLEKGDLTLIEMLRAEDLRLACDQLARFAHWITPANTSKRFDTQFFLAAAPLGHLGQHGGREAVDSVWITPSEATAMGGSWKVVFPTRLNLLKLGTSLRLEEAMRAARSAPPLTIEPRVEEGPGGAMLRIREDAGYPQTSALLKESL
jgi:8-oxo-dGTP pyrophosphatase MutT (NUDIX family)